MGRHKKPLELQKGNLTVEQQNQKAREEEIMKTGINQVKCPVWVKDKNARKEFKRLSTQLLLIDAITNLDVNNLAQYCVAYGNYVKATLELSEQPLTTTKQLPNGSYQIVENPLIRVQLKYGDDMRKFASLCGLTFDSRAKMAVVKVQKENNNIEEEFGDI